MNPGILLIILMCLVAKPLFGQTKLRKMPSSINRPSTDNFAPYISFDGTTLVFIASVGDDDALTMCMARREGVNWNDPILLPKVVNNHLNFLKGFALSTDGKTLYLTTSKAAGLGGFDLYTSQLSGNSWGEPVNMGLPVNTSSNEGSPSLSIDGNALFFMRCDKMDFAKADNCKLMIMTKKPNGRWDDPQELPPFINTGNSQTPRIMGDGEMLVFSSNKLQPNKGGMDLYFTKLIEEKWNNPLPLDFVNTPGDDQYVSTTLLGRYLTRDMPGQAHSELAEVLFPSEVRPKGVMRIEGTVTGPGDPSTVFVSAFNMKDQSRVFSTKPEKDGTFVAYIKEGGLYDLSVEPEKDNYTFFSKRFDLTGEKFSLVEKVSINLKPASSGDEVALEGISFKANSHEINPSSNQELRRLTRMIQGNPDKSFSVLVTLAGYEKDSVRSNPDLTEVIIDTLKFPTQFKIDSLTMGTRDSLVIKQTYHNDRTLQQAKTIGEYLINAGIPAGHIACSGKAQPEAILENRKTHVKIVIH